MSYIEKKYKEFIDKHGYIPNIFEPYNTREIKDNVHPTLTAHSYPSAASAGGC